MEKYVAIYVRRSVSDRDKGNNSLSIDSQKADCMKQLKKGEKYRLYCDDGKSGKDIAHRPEFQRMMDDAKAGLISRIVVKKYDRFSRNLREYLNVTDVLDRYGVSVISLTEPFNTETKEGRLMRNNLLNFAEFERETIAGRVADAYGTRAAETGFYQGGKVYYGYIPERRTVNGKTGSVLVPSDRADVVRTAYTLYKNPDISLSNVLSYFIQNGIEVNIDPKKNMDRSHLSQILKSPLYVRADKEVYQYFVSKGYHIIDDIEAAEDCDVFIDCTNAETFMNDSYFKYERMGKALVIATTAFSAEAIEKIGRLGVVLPVFMSGNFSVALHDFIAVLKVYAKRTSLDTDIQIIEYHHNQKKDAPSGTALMIKAALMEANENIYKEKVKICSVRGGNIFGEHEVVFANSKDEVVTFRHQVSSREAFAEGAIEAAVWTVKQANGLYNMDDFCDRSHFEHTDQH